MGNSLEGRYSRDLMLYSGMEIQAICNSAAVYGVRVTANFTHPPGTNKSGAHGLPTARILGREDPVRNNASWSLETIFDLMSEDGAIHRDFWRIKWPIFLGQNHSKNPLESTHNNEVQSQHRYSRHRLRNRPPSNGGLIQRRPPRCMYVSILNFILDNVSNETSDYYSVRKRDHDLLLTLPRKSL